MDHALVKEFLTLVLPWDDPSSFKSIWIKGPKQDPTDKGSPTWGFVGTTLDELMRFVEVSERKPNHDIYVGLGSQARPRADDPTRDRRWKRSDRTRDNIVSFRCLFIDVDAGANGSYPDTQAALAALYKFAADANLPVPNVIVLSGSGGLHAYWTFEASIPVQRWQPLAQALVHAIRHHGLICDDSCTADASRILRVPSTLNWKSDPPTEVQMYQPLAPYPVEVLEEILKTYAGPRLVGPVGPKPELSDVAKRFTAGLDEAGQAPPVDLYEIADNGCLVLADAIDTAGRDHKQPLWNLLMLAATFDKEPEVTAHAFSDGYSGYDPEEVDGMLARKRQERTDRNIGWPSCAAFEAADDRKLCLGCTWRGRIQRPMEIAKLVAQPQANAKGPTPHDDLPPGYWRDGVTGYITTWVEHGSGNKKARVTAVVLNNPLWDPELEANGLGFRCKTMLGQTETYVFFETTRLADGKNFNLALLENRIYPSREQEPLARAFFMAWLDKLQKEQTTRFASDTLGWNADLDAFTYGKLTYSTTGAEDAFVKTPYPDYEPVGRIDPWLKASRLITDQKRPALDAIIAAAFAGPLVALLGMPGLMFVVRSQRSGAGKSSAVKISQAVWGHPVKGVNALGDTSGSITKKLADIRSFPLYWDELKMKKEVEAFVDLIFRVSQGRGKARLSRTIEQRDPGTFQTLIVGCSNESIAEAVATAVPSTDAGVARVFEVETDMPAVPVNELQYAVDDLSRHYGRAGETYSEFLGKYHAPLQSAVRNQFDGLRTQTGAAPEERFWLAVASCLLVGARSSNYLKLTDIDMPGLEGFLVQSLTGQRQTRIENMVDFTSADSIEGLIDRMVNQNRRASLIVTTYVHQANSRPTTPNKVLSDTMYLNEVWLQFGETDDTLRIKVDPLRRWLVQNHWQLSGFRQALLKHNIPFTERKATIGSGVSNQQLSMLDRKQVACIDIRWTRSLISETDSS